MITSTVKTFFKVKLEGLFSTFLLGMEEEIELLQNSKGLLVSFVLLAMRKEMRILVSLMEEKGNCGLCEYVPSYFRGMKRRHC